MIIMGPRLTQWQNARALQDDATALTSGCGLSESAGWGALPGPGLGVSKADRFRVTYALVPFRVAPFGAGQRT
jgi:hypothetical protein